MTINDVWHFPRTALAQQILSMFEVGLSSVLVFFAPRRMGKTEFLLKDILPLAKSKEWQVIYFSFLDAESAAAEQFISSLTSTGLESSLLSKTRHLFRHIKKISGEAAGLRAEMEFTQQNNSIKEIITALGQQGKTLLLLDEIQALAQYSKNKTFIAALRTALDINKDHIKVIFTGSSREGLRKMFSQANAPFFHFGLNLPFPELDQAFTDHLCQIYTKITKRQIDRDQLWEIFKEMHFIPLLARSLVEKILLNPTITMDEAKQQLMNDVFTERAFDELWVLCSALERLLLQEIAHDNSALFSNDMKIKLAHALGIEEIEIPAIQSAVRTLLRKGLLGKQLDRGLYFIDDPNFKTWIQLNKMSV